MATPTQGDIGDPHPTPSTTGSGYALGTAILSTVIPGLGQLVQKRVVSGALYFAGFLGLCAIAFLTRAASTYFGVLLLLFALFAYNTIASCDAFFARRGIDDRKAASILLIIPFVSACIFASVQWGVLVRATGFMFFEVPSSGMLPTIERNSHIMADLQAYSDHSPARGDVLIMKRDGTFYVKRLIGLPGNVVSINGGVVSINGQPIEEPYALLGSDADAYGRYFDPVSVPENSYFVLGDNRDISVDSRKSDFGMVTRRELVGKALYLFESPRNGSRIDLEQPAAIHGDPTPP